MKAALYLPCLVFILDFGCNIENAAGVHLRDHGYEDLLIAIHDHVPEDPQIISNLKSMVTEASYYLFNATKRRFYYREVKILIPNTWKSYNVQRPRHEAHQMASVIVSNPNPYYGNDPYTLHYGGCGNEGRYIHFTPDYLTDDSVLLIYGPRGRVFVHEWAHFRWGVFDEYSYEKPFYVSDDGKIKTTRCSSELAGMYVCKESSCSDGECLIDQQTGNLKEGCMFLANSTQDVKTSVMYMQALDSVVDFCDEHNHNTEAPTMQNKMCGYRSTWNVIQDSDDYKSTIPVSGTRLPSPPSFILMQTRERVVCLVLDVSDNMSKGDRLHRLRQAAAIFIQHVVEEGSRVAIVTFNETAEVRSHLLNITSDDTRQNLTASLPVVSGGGISICKGILAGLQVIKEFEGGAEGSEIILAIGGNDRDLSNCLPEVALSGSVIHTIAIGPTADPELEHLAEMTGGSTFYASDSVDSHNLIKAFMEISPKYGSVAETFVMIKNNKQFIKPGDHLYGSVFLDRTVGNDTTFIITWQASEPPAVVIEDPTGSSDIQPEHDYVSHISYLNIPGSAQDGTWTYNITNTLNDSQLLGVFVTSRTSLKLAELLRVSAGKISNTVTFPHPLTISVEVKLGYTAVLGANVTAVIEAESGEELVVTLSDNGAGADVAKDDGVYSSYVFRFTQNGRHTMTIYAELTNITSPKHAQTQSNGALYVAGYIENGMINMNPPRPVHNGEIQSMDEPFSRVLFLGCLRVMNVSGNALNEDVFPPGKITDLEAKADNGYVALTWTAPGDDYDQGAVSKYDIRISARPLILTQRFFRATYVNASHIEPKNAGSRETFTFRLWNLTAHQNIIYIAIRSTDKAGQQSEVSNLVHVATPRTQEEDMNHAYSTAAARSSSTTVIVTAALALSLCLAIGAGIYTWRKYSLYILHSRAADSESLWTNRRVKEEEEPSTECQYEEFPLQVISSGDWNLLEEQSLVL
ncbi:calcium-activated chloride channel regulator 3A-1-like [Hyperolius riggenbachi]|uniref:calcium-activated chloride channel regulator 3A-1-like n=1 Tax=Hyperolius riggenbachi TaxID=752182 RepID=UPI0035A3A7AB